MAENQSDLLPFHQHILETLLDPLTSDLLLVARGLGLRKLICHLLRIYDTPRNLVLLVNAMDEDVAIGEELGVMGCRNPGLRILGWEMGRKERLVFMLFHDGNLTSDVKANALHPRRVDLSHVAYSRR